MEQEDDRGRWWIVPAVIVAFGLLFGVNGCERGGGVVGWVSEWMSEGNAARQFKESCSHVDALREHGWLSQREAEKIVERIRRGTK